MFAATLILAFSGALFLYWFRYSCLLILQTRSARGAESAPERGFQYPSVRRCLRVEDLAGESLDRLEGQLLADYSILEPLVARTGRAVFDPVERWMLILDYKLMRLWFFATRRTSAASARGALSEMSEILSYFATNVGPRLGETSA